MANKMPILAYLLIVFLGILLILQSEFWSEISSMRAKHSDKFDRGVVFYQDKNEVVLEAYYGMFLTTSQLPKEW